MSKDKRVAGWFVRCLKRWASTPSTCGDASPADVGLSTESRSPPRAPAVRSARPSLTLIREARELVR
jgi:hypothetical protein